MYLIHTHTQYQFTNIPHTYSNNYLCLSVHLLNNTSLHHTSNSYSTQQYHRAILLYLLNALVTYFVRSGKPTPTLLCLFFARPL